MNPAVRLNMDISTHSAREDGDFTKIIPVCPYIISTHSAREDGDFLWPGTASEDGSFQPTPPARTETGQWIVGVFNNLFQPTPPARTETHASGTADTVTLFQPTPPARTETDF